jgi:Rrf2 family nitric oxide-sensitive transcriptional repressor
VRLTVYTDFSLRVLMFLAVKPDGLATIAEIATAYRISKNHLMKVAHQLGVAGYIETIRGKGGGLRLARLPSEIVLGEVVRRTEPDMALVSCFDPADNNCVIFRGCALRDVLGEARDAFLAVLDRCTLADLIDKPAQLRKLLFLGAAKNDSRTNRASGRAAAK